MRPSRMVPPRGSMNFTGKSVALGGREPGMEVMVTKWARSLVQEPLRSM